MRICCALLQGTKVPATHTIAADVMASDARNEGLAILKGVDGFDMIVDVALKAVHMANRVAERWSLNLTCSLFSLVIKVAGKAPFTSRS